jgi:putative ABC transport system permease protein
MFRIALHMLMGDKAKYWTLVSGLSFVALLFVQQGSVFLGLISRTARPVEAIGAPIWVADPALRAVDEFKPLLDTDLTRVRSVPGVLWAVPLFVRQLQARLPDGRFQNIRLIGLDSASLIGLPGVMIQGRPEALRLQDAVIIGDADSGRLGSPGVGDVFEINDRQARVVGIADLRKDFFSNPYVFTTYERALDYSPQQRRQLSYIVAAPQKGRDIREVVESIRSTTGLAAYTEDEMRWLTMRFYLENTGIPISFGISLLLVFIVGMAIAGQTFYSFALQNERYFGALKAMGTSSWTLVRMIVLQGAVVGVIGFGIGAGAASLIGWLNRTGEELAYLTNYQLVAISFVVTMAICLLSSLHGISRVLRLEPAVVFRSS